MTRAWQSADTVEQKQQLLDQRSRLYQLAGRPDQALEDLETIGHSLSSPSDELNLRIYQLKYETGQWNFLSELSQALNRQEGDSKIPFVIIKVRLLMSLGEWDQAQSLLSRYRSMADKSSVLAYLNWFFYQRSDNTEQTRYWADFLQSRFPHSLETGLVLGTVELQQTPSILFLNQGQSAEVFYYQAGAYQQKERAEELITDLQQKGIECRMLFREGWYKVVISSPYSQDTALLELLEQWDIKAFRVSY